jgi:DNA polymerase-3 subunit alpha
MVANGYSKAAIDALWGTLLPFCDYGFNKSHTAGYGLVSYWTAYLKANYPAEYMAALLTSVKDDKDKMAVYLAECRRMGIKVLPPCVNSSDANFTPVGEDIRFGLTAVRNVGANVVTSVVATRAAKGSFVDFADFLRKVDAVVCNKRTIEALIKGGAFDSMNHPRRGLINVYEPAVDAVLDTKRAEAIGQFDLFGSLGDDDVDGAADPAVDVFAVRVPEGEWDKKVLLQFEREMLGLYVSDHPLFGLEHVLANAADETIATALAESEEPRPVTLAGILSSVNRRVTKAGAPWASAVLEDLEGSIEVMFFPQTYASVALTIAEDAVVAIKGRTDAREDTVKLIASDLQVLDTTQAPRGPVVMTMEPTRCTPPLIGRLKEILAAHPGTTEVHLRLAGRHEHVLRLDAFRVRVTPALMSELKPLLGPTAVSA